MTELPLNLDASSKCNNSLDQVKYENNTETSLSNQAINDLKNQDLNYDRKTIKQSKRVK